MDARSAKALSKDDWAKMAGDADSIFEGRCFINGEYVDAQTYPGSVARRCPDISKAKKDLGYDPKVNWKDGLKVTIEWYIDYLNKNKDLHESFYDNKKK